jgi:hypothetical protein
VTEPDEIEQLIMERQKVHFGQASPTPFANAPLKSTSNWTGTSPEVQVVLNGDYVPSHKVDSQSNRILQSCTQKMPPVSSFISLDAMKNKYRSWKETTSTSPSGLHLGHKHALLKPDGLVRDSDEFQHLDAACNEIWGMHHMMLNYGLKHGYCFDRWKKVVTTLIEKDPGDPRIHHLRVIHLYEDCYNLLLGMTYCTPQKITIFFTKVTMAPVPANPRSTPSVSRSYMLSTATSQGWLISNSATTQKRVTIGSSST